MSSRSIIDPLVFSTCRKAFSSYVKVIINDKNRSCKNTNKKKSANNSKSQHNSQKAIIHRIIINCCNSKNNHKTNINNSIKICVFSNIFFFPTCISKTTLTMKDKNLSNNFSYDKHSHETLKWFWKKN